MFKKMIFIIFAFLFCCTALTSTDVIEEIDNFAIRYHANPDPQQAVVLLKKYFRSVNFTSIDRSSYLYDARLCYFFSRILKSQPNLIPEFITMFEQGNHNQRVFIIHVLGMGGDETVRKYFETNLQKGRFINEKQQIDWYLYQGIPIQFDIFTSEVEHLEHLDYLIAEFMFNGSEPAIMKIIEIITEPNLISPEVQNTNHFVKHGKTLLGNYGKLNNKILNRCKEQLTNASDSKREILEDIIDSIDGSIITAKLIANAKNEKPVTGAKAWALGASAVLIEYNQGRHNFLSPRLINKKSIENQRSVLNKWWDVNSKDELLETMERLMNKGHRAGFKTRGEYIHSLDEKTYQQLLKEYENDYEELHEIKILREHYAKLGPKGILGWDISRYICLCRWGYLSGYLTEEQAWEKIMPAAKMLQNEFDSWEDLGQNYIIGRKYWSYKHTIESGEEIEDAYQRLVDMKSSPWNLYPWDLDLSIEPDNTK